MAEALISVVLEQLGSIAIHELVKEVELLAGVEEEVESLIGTLTLIQGVLEDAEQKQVTNKAVKFWLDKIKEISYDADDVLDEWSTRILISKMQQPDVDAPIKEKVQSHLFSFFCCIKSIVIRHAIGVKIKELNEQLEGLAKKKDMHNLTKIRSQKESRPITSSIVNESEIYGREVDIEIIMSKLFNSSHHDLKVPIISIVGTGGFGKTALAQVILKEKKVVNHFEKQIWVCVSDPFDHQKVAKQIIEEATGKVIETFGWQALHRGLSESIQGKLFILVLDDVWSVNGECWNQLKTSLDGGAIGSRIIITTRNEDTAKLMGSISTDVHRLKELLYDASWLMFRHIAFWRREGDLEYLEIIAKNITKKCKGVPLAIRVLASLMRLKKTVKDWKNVLASNIWDIQQGGDGFLPSILFSYYAIPAELKPCLIYCAIFPKGAELQKKELVELWMAQGYLGSDGSKDLESVGGEHFDNLAMRSFYQDCKKDSKGNITSCKMHKLVHDFVKFLGKSETFILEEKEHESGRVRHLSTSRLDMLSIYQQMKLRTLRPVMWSYPKKSTHLGLLHQLVCLRVLDLCGNGLEELPSEMENLLHLRYLNLSWTGIKELPVTICNLLNLQTLKLKGCSKLAKLPKGIGKLCNLRHLQISGTDNLTYLPQGLGRLSCLRTLNKFVTGDGDEIEEIGCNIRELKLLNHLQGESLISRLGRVANANEAAEAELEKKKNLHSLILSFSKSEEEHNDDDEKILKGLLPHTNLEKLRVMYYRGTNLPDWISLLFNLVKLDLVNLEEILQLPALGKLPYLEVLVLNELKSVKRIGEEFYGLSGYSGGRDSLSQQQQKIVFPKLKKLEFANMDAWEEWDLPYQNENDINFFPNLVELEIYQCNVMHALPPGLGKLKSLETLVLKRFMGHKFWGILNKDRNEGGLEDNGEFVKPAFTAVVVFPALTSLELRSMWVWEDEMIPKLKVDLTTSITIMPNLSKLVIEDCPMLKVIPFYMFSQALRDLEISKCPQLTGLQPGLPPLLEKLTLSESVGVLTSSLFPISISLHNKNYQNLNSFRIFDSTETCLPKGFNLLTSIRQLQFVACKFLDFMPDDLRHLTMLEQLHIKDCPLLEKQFREGSSSSSHDYNISIWPEQQKLAEIEESSQSDVRVHIGIMCDNCQMYPIIGKRYKCKNCWEERTRTERGIGFDLCEGCYHTRSNHPDIVNQHHTLGHHTLIANRGDSSVPVLAEGGLVVAKLAEIEKQKIA